MSADEKLEKALELLERVEVNEVPPPDDGWYRDYYLLLGEHMILMDECWEPGSGKQAVIDEFGEDAILDEINAPEVSAPTDTTERKS